MSNLCKTDKGRPKGLPYFFLFIVLVLNCFQLLECYFVQVLYAYLKGKEKNWSNDVIAERTHLIIFYPLGKEYNKLDPDAFLRLPIEEQAMRCAKEIVFTEADLKAVIDDYFIQNILMINQTDFSKFDGSEGHLGHDCSYCPFAGAKPNPEIGFMGCPKSLEAEIEFPEGFEVVTSEEYKKRKEAEKNG